MALLRDHEIVATADLPDTRRASEMLPAVVDDLLSRHELKATDLHAVIVSRGPGGFTGTRVAVTFAKVLTAFTDATLVAVDTADVVVRRVPTEEQRACVVFDARRRSVWVQPYVANDGRWHRDGVHHLVAPQSLGDHVSTDTLLVGEGVGYYAEALHGYRHHPDYWPRVADVAAIGLARLAAGEVDDPSTLLPLYVRQPQALENLAGQGVRDS